MLRSSAQRALMFPEHTWKDLGRPRSKIRSIRDLGSVKAQHWLPASTRSACGRFSRLLPKWQEVPGPELMQQPAGALGTAALGFCSPAGLFWWGHLARGPGSPPPRREPGSVRHPIGLRRIKTHVRMRGRDIYSPVSPLSAFLGTTGILTCV